jgi:hypothetical protein
MAPIKFEENIREKLQERELEPSADAWNKLNAKLDSNLNKKNKVVNIYWYSIAASIAGILIIASVFLNENKSKEGNKQLVVNENVSEKENIKQDSEDSFKQVIPQEIEKEQIASEERIKENILPKVNIQNSKYKTSITKQPVNNQEEAIAVKINKGEEIEKKLIPEKVQFSKEELLFNTKVDEVVAKVQELKNNNTTITEKEIDALMANAQREIKTERILSGYKVDAAALLNDVEMELERSFRDKVFEALGDGFQIIRTAVVERNN